MSIFDSQNPDTPPSEIPVAPDTFERDNSIGRMGQFSRLTVGAGDDVFKFTKEAAWMGGAEYDTAPIQFDYRNGKINLGITNVQFDGGNSRMLVNDGTNDRVLIGKGVGLF